MELYSLLYDIGACPRRPCQNGFYPIHEAAKHASAGSMEILLKFGEHNGCPREEMISFFDAEGNVPLHSAVHGGDIKAVELCLRSGAKISTQQHDLSTPIHLACSQGAIEIVKLMFQLQPEEKETCLKSCDLQRMTPLHCASMFDHYELVEFLVKQGASVNVLDKERRSPLHLAAFRNGWQTMKALIRMGANISLKDNDNRNVLHAAVIHGGDLDKILDEESCVSTSSLSVIESDFIPILEEKDKNGFTALHYAVKQGHIKNAMKLISLGASIITKNNIGENVMHIACSKTVRRYGRLNIVQQILKMEQNNSVINEGDGEGLTPLHIASMFGHVRVVQALMKKGALLHRDHNGNTPAHLAAKNGHRETVKLILNVHSHLLDQTDKDGNTPIHIASMENQPDAVDLLLTLNCNLTYNYKGFSAIDFALQNKYAGVALVMVTHRTRGNEILAMSSGKHPSIMLALVATMPQVVAAVLDRCIIKSDAKSDSENYNVSPRHLLGKVGKQTELPFILLQVP
ncbi:Transient receptor potential cation channel subfamily A member 1 [Orchesella cincta]|uniref:Transient receptor potential cation channel subfamily A member 1 n=1 Tax=Orchesella cincta TaxID=48709 RepID=A0A1D2N2V5_ORCCI|nr:Transient receptor potential cation channel subfamily A member 1 [Orchesella cincta]